jgi:hypothetical protein
MYTTAAAAAAAAAALLVAADQGLATRSPTVCHHFIRRWDLI